jgi:nicotinate-nucleotide pyrophosphorylase (carboxylating)
MNGRVIVRYHLGVQDLNEITLSALFERLTGDWRKPASPLRRLLELARDEDMGLPQSGGDVTSVAAIDASAVATAAMVAREDLVVAGLRCLPGLTGVFGPSVRAEARVADGAKVAAGAVLAEFSGPLLEILALERTTLNLVSRLCGVAAMAHEFAERVRSVGRARVYDTRKTTPGLRSLEKYATRCGGACCHRVGLYDAVLIKDNHLAGVKPGDFAAFVAATVSTARQAAASERRHLSFVELEVDSLEQFDRVLAAGGCGVDIVLLDNMSLHNLRQAVAQRDRSGLGIQLEASGGVRLDTVRAIAETGVERISAGAITHGAVSRDIAFDIVS